jgi:hypothetical protein
MQCTYMREAPVTSPAQRLPTMCQMHFNNNNIEDVVVPLGGWPSSGTELSLVRLERAASSERELNLDFCLRDRIITSRVWISVWTGRWVSAFGAGGEATNLKANCASFQ